MSSLFRPLLNDEQYNAVIYTAWSSLILAAAWSGKTRALTYKIAHLVIDGHASPSQIMAVTFTNKAAKEMSERLRTIIDSLPAEISQDLMHKYHDIRFPWIGTFHSLFLKILKHDIEQLGLGYTKSFGIYDTTDTAKIIKTVLKNQHAETVFEPREIKNIISRLKNEGKDPASYKKDVKNDYDQTIFLIYQEYQHTLIQANSLDFDDLLLLPFLLFRLHPDVLRKWQERFKFILVDEAQDTNEIQFLLMKMLTGDTGNITFIGDDFQSIYGWRWAVMDHFLNLQKYWPDMKSFLLVTNYRSRPHIIEAANTIIKNNRHQYDKTVHAHREGRDHLVLLNHPDETAEAINILAMIRKLRTQKIDKGCDRGDFAILYRTNAQSSIFEKICIQEGIPYKVFGAYKFFERSEVKDILAYARFVRNPKDNMALERIINLPTRGISDTTRTLLSEEAKRINQSVRDLISQWSYFSLGITTRATSALEQWTQMANRWLAMVAHNTAPWDIIDRIVTDIAYKQYLIKHEWEEWGQEKFENIGQLINMAEKFRDEAETAWWLTALESYLDEITLLTDIAGQEWDHVNAIKLMTIHASKWLEFPTVFIVWLEDNLFPMQDARLDDKKMEEERRLMYVAITRAQDYLFLSYANTRMTRWRTISNPPSRFIKEIPADLIKSYDLQGASTSWSSKYTKKTFEEGDRVKHALFGKGTVIEAWKGVCIVKFDNPKFSVRRLEMHLLQEVGEEKI